MRWKAVERRGVSVGSEVGTVERIVADYLRPAGGSALPYRDPVWHGKSVSADETLLVAGEGGLSAPIVEPAVTSVQMFFGDFAVVRADSWADPAATFFFLFNCDGRWRIAGEVSARAALGVRRAAYDPQTAERDVLDVLDVYYRAVETGDAAALERVFHPAWHMKNIEGGRVVAEGREAFAKRLEKPTRGYIRDRQIADVQVVFDRMAFARIDKPSTPGVTVFALFKLAGRWLIVDKVWSAALS
jgi:hypothetical protein